MVIHESCACGAVLEFKSERISADLDGRITQNRFHKQHQDCRNVVITKIRAMRLTPGKEYLIIAGAGQIPESEFALLREEFKNRGIKGLILAVRGDADDIKIMEFKGGEQNHES